MSTDDGSVGLSIGGSRKNSNCITSNKGHKKRVTANAPRTHNTSFRTFLKRGVFTGGFI
jgi:hypothetical protein